MSSSLYKITGNILDMQLIIQNGVDDEGFLEALEETLSCNTEEFEQKALQLAYVLGELNADISVIDDEVGRLKARKTSLVNTQQRIKDYLLNSMQVVNKKTIKNATHTITIRKGMKSVKVENTTVLGDEFVVVKSSIVPDKKAIMDAFKAGKEVTGAKVIIGNDTISIK